MCRLNQLRTTTDEMQVDLEIEEDEGLHEEVAELLEVPEVVVGHLVVAGEEEQKEEQRP